MSRFLDSLFDELFARRRRIQKRFGQRFGGLLEFLLFSGLILGLFALFYGGWYGVTPIVVFGAAYVWLDRRRQAALAQSGGKGGGSEAIGRRYDRAALAVLLATSFLGALAFYGAYSVDAQRQAREAREAPPPPPHAVELDLVPDLSH